MIAKIWKNAWSPPDKRTPSEWCEEHVKSIPYSPMPGAFRSENSPWVREIMEAIVDTRIKLVSISASIQSSKTMSPELTLCYIIANLPGPALWLDQTDDDARDQSESRLQKLFGVCEPVKKQFAKDRHKMKNTSMQFANGMTLWVLGAKNKTNLQRRSIRWLFGDETWRWPQGHMAEAEARTTAFGWLGKCVFMSQGSIEGDDTDKKFKTTDQREWHYKCPKCGEYIAYKWENIEWDDDCKDENGEYDFEKINNSTALKCANCGEYFEDSDKQRRILNKDGKFIAMNPRASKENAGFHWNALANLSWGKLAELYLQAKIQARKGLIDDLRIFHQKRLALPWSEYEEEFKLDIPKSGYLLGEDWDEETGIDEDGDFIEQPFCDTDKIIGRLRILTVDVQMNCFYLIVRAWNSQGSSRLIWHEKVLTWEDIEAVQKRFNVQPMLVCIDAGYTSSEVYKQCGRRGWTALMGTNKINFIHTAKNGRKIYRFYSSAKKQFISKAEQCNLYYWSNLNAKDILTRLRKSSSDLVSWEIPSDVSEDYIKQMDSERRVKAKNGWIWEQIGKRDNHYFDCESMNVVMALMLKLIGSEQEESA